MATDLLHLRDAERRDSDATVLVVGGERGDLDWKRVLTAGSNGEGNIRIEVIDA